MQGLNDSQKAVLVDLADELPFISPSSHNLNEHVGTSVPLFLFHLSLISLLFVFISVIV